MKKQKNILLIFGIIILVVIVAIGIEKFKVKETQEARSDLLERLNNFPQLKGKQPVEIKQLTKEDIEIQSKQYPVIYSGAEEEDYLVTYENLLVLYDYENNEIKKEFNLQTINLG